MAPEVARILAIELKKDDMWVQQQVKNFTAVAAQYVAAMA